jgi:hypothetical protein
MMLLLWLLGGFLAVLVISVGVMLVVYVVGGRHKPFICELV